MGLGRGYRRHTQVSSLIVIYFGGDKEAVFDGHAEQGSANFLGNSSKWTQENTSRL